MDCRQGWAHNRRGCRLVCPSQAKRKAEFQVKHMKQGIIRRTTIAPPGDTYEGTKPRFCAKGTGHGDKGVGRQQCNYSFHDQTCRDKDFISK